MDKQNSMCKKHSARVANHFFEGIYHQIQASTSITQSLSLADSLKKQMNDLANKKREKRTLGDLITYFKVPQFRQNYQALMNDDQFVTRLANEKHFKGYDGMTTKRFLLSSKKPIQKAWKCYKQFSRKQRPKRTFKKLSQCQKIQEKLKSDEKEFKESKCSSEELNSNKRKIVSLLSMSQQAQDQQKEYLQSIPIQQGNLQQNNLFGSSSIKYKGSFCHPQSQYFHSQKFIKPEDAEEASGYFMKGQSELDCQQNLMFTQQQNLQQYSDII